jgi:hypothetical protein
MTGILRIVGHSDMLRRLAQGWRPVADLGPVHGEWSSLMWWCCGDCLDGEAP